MKRRLALALVCAVALPMLALAGVLTVGISAACAADDSESAAVRDPDYAAGKQAVERKDWREALNRFRQAALRDPDNPDLLSYLGFSYQNLGQLDAAFRHYKRALELDPRHRGAHEHIGEVYLRKGDLVGAERHLAALRKICGRGCAELADLERDITAYRKRTGAGRSP
ncbi:MAG: tetratricopeptide repeat protein [Candidatus Rokuibacteriota bacterium]